MIDPPHIFGAKTLTQKWESIMHRTLDTATNPRKRERWRHIIDPSSMNKLTANWLCNTTNMSIAPPRPTALALVSSRASASVIRPHKSWRWQLMPSTTQQHTKLNRQRINSRRAVKVFLLLWLMPCIWTILGSGRWLGRWRREELPPDCSRKR